MDCTIVKGFIQSILQEIKGSCVGKGQYCQNVRKELPTGKTKLLRLRLSSYHDPQKSFSKRKKQLIPTKNWLERLFKTESNVKPMKDTGLLEIEKKPYYSYLFAMSPRIAKNRGCIRLEGNGRRNIDFVQVIQKN
jgi:hypothetical protein